MCGACRAATRIVGILQSGGLDPSYERKVTGLLRGVAGELSHLVESGALAGQGQDPPGKVQPPQGETTGLTPGPKEEKQVKDEDKDSEYTYTEDREGEDPESEDEGEDPPRKEEIPGEKEAPKKVEAEISEDKTEKKEIGREKPAEGQQRRLHPNFNPNYLTARLQLFPTGKASARPGKGSEAPTHSSGGRDSRSGGDRDRTPKRSTGDRPSGDGHRGDDEHDGGTGHGRRGSEKPVSPERHPLQRRIQPEKAEGKKKHKSNKGQKRRDRGHEFKAWRESRNSSRGQ